MSEITMYWEGLNVVKENEVLVFKWIFDAKLLRDIKKEKKWNVLKTSQKYQRKKINKKTR